jgi:hypothetical protein
MKPAHPEYWKIEPVKIPLSIKIGADVLAWQKARAIKPVLTPFCGKQCHTRNNEPPENF